MSLKLIAIVGKKQSGKDTTAELLKQHIKFPHKYHRLGFADALKDEICRALLIRPDYLEKNKSNFRLIMQGWGTDYRRELCGKSYWIVKFLERLRKIHTDDKSNTYVIVPDVRFLNEANALRELNATFVRINRNESTDIHASEVEQDIIGCKYIIDNSGTLEDLKRTIDNLATSILT